MIKRLLICLIAIQLTIQTCDKGCLKCDSDNQCLMCDVLSNYKLVSSKCESVTNANCTLADQDGKCLACDSQYYLNSSNACVAVESAKLVTGCVSYDSSQNCLTCQTDKYLNQAACSNVTTAVTNCDVHSSATLCSSCKENFYLSDDKLTCTAYPTISNCLKYSMYQCETCTAQTVMNKNLYFSIYTQTFTTVRDTLMSWIILNKNNSYSFENHEPCQDATVSDCVEYEDFEKCKTCSPNYFLTDTKKCEEYPDDKISNCKVYSSVNVCVECNSGYYRESSTSCKAIVSPNTIENCSKYDGTSSSITCMECIAERYLQGNACTNVRTVSAGSQPANCKEKEISADACKTCNSNYTLVSGGSKCLPNQDNCMSHDQPSSTATVTVCNKCNDNYYLNAQKVCTLGTDQNCLTFNTNSDDCSVCDF